MKTRAIALSLALASWANAQEFVAAVRGGVQVLQPPTRDGLRADYFPSLAALTAAPTVGLLPTKTQVVSAVNTSFGAGGPASGIPSDGFSVRWSGQVRPPRTGTYVFRTSCDDGVRLWVNGVLLINQWGPSASRQLNTVGVELEVGRSYDIRMDYGDWSGDASAELAWRVPGVDRFATITKRHLFPAMLPFEISQGGIYVGSWQSDDPESGVIRIQTTEPVNIERSDIRGVTAHANDSRGLITTGVFDTQVVLRDVHFEGSRAAILGEQQARFYNTLNPRRLTIENCTIVGTQGLRVLNYENHPPADFIRVLRNSARNLDGRMNDDTGGYIPWAGRYEPATDQYIRGSFGGTFIQLNAVVDQPNIEVAWNQIVNEPFKSTSEDIFSIFVSGGTPASPALFHNNYIQGGYTATPDRDGSVAAGGFVYFYTHTGTGMNLGDNAGAATVGHIRCYSNQVISTSNAGIGFAGGQNIHVYNNRVVASGRLPDGRQNPSSFTGIAGWDFYATGPTLFFGNVVRDNYSAWNHSLDNNQYVRNDYEYRVAGPGGLEPDPLNPVNPVPGLTTSNNISGPSPTLATEAAEWILWQNKLTTSNVRVGNRYTIE